MAGGAMKRARVLFYVQHLLGIGHLARASRVAGALADDGFEVSVVTGGVPVPGFPGSKVEHVALPAITSRDEGFSGLVDAAGNAVDAAFQARRRDLLTGLFRDRRPDILVIEAFPFGRRQVRFELLPLLDAAVAAQPRPLVATSIRDILQERTKPGRNEETVDLVRNHFDLVLVHGDPHFVRLEETFPLAADIASKVAYTGLVAAQPAQPSHERYDIVVSAGGGAAGRDLVRAAVEASRILDGGLAWCLITGPNLPQDEYAAAISGAPANMAVHRFRRDFAALLAASRLSVSQAGYNTVCDILQARCRSVLVPFAAGGETEQPLRAARLEALGLAKVLAERDVAGQTLAEAIRRAFDAPLAAGHALALDGARNSARILRRALEARRGVPD
ncbi:glycosyltransferase family protein [Arvimicrobium flavum]|uniref:glycosyltransferase family protein n=1 Tax=Arvimicrobium flavum TaxID=3393320 RepID=UPI00237AA2FD|nr:glycosyltransferase [Mesorhizobium shangrilense]